MSVALKILENQENEQLKEKYNFVFERCKKHILDNFPDLEDASDYKFYYSDKVLKNSSILLSLPISDSSKGWCNKKDRSIHISDWALAKGGVILRKVLLHELLHINFPEKTEDEIVLETEKRLNSIKKDTFSILFF